MWAYVRSIMCEARTGLGEAGRGPALMRKGTFVPGWRADEGLTKKVLSDS